MRLEGGSGTGEQGQFLTRILAQYQAILDIETYLSLNKLLAPRKNPQQVACQGQEAAHRGHRSTQAGSPGGPHVNRSAQSQAETRPPGYTGLKAVTAFNPASRKAGKASRLARQSPQAT